LKKFHAGGIIFGGGELRKSWWRVKKNLIPH